MGISDIDVDEHVFRIRTEGEPGNESFRLYKWQTDGVKEKFKTAVPSPGRTGEFQEVSADNAVDLGGLFRKLSHKKVEQVKRSTTKIFKELNDVYKNSEKEFSLSNSEAAYHGFFYGALALNFKYRYGLNCYVERTAGNGRADLILMSHTKDANGRINPKPIPVVVEFKAKDHTASEAIKQIKDKGYLYNLSVRTRAKDAVIVGVNPAQSDALQVEQDEIFQSQNFLRQLLEEMGKLKMKNTLKGELKNLYHLIPSHDQHYLSKVIFGQVAAKADGFNKRIFIYEGKDKSIGEEATTFVLFNQNKAVILNIIEHTQKKPEVDPHGRTRSSQKQGNIFDNNRIPSIDKLGIDSAVKIDVKIRTGEALSSFEVEGDKNKSYYQDINIEEVSNINSKSKYQGEF
ncbi:PD-(D/E)XK nuclease domain-containing protein [Wolbachia endosymbiont (group A) of Colletes cunicularius]|uniref:PD-(D/E)XK nuclease domain-containing protein n=1 Tax=Wolbachia endosymbiont (group A) of Colletes cunicularius TaxID=3139321 RepID=UPI0035C8D934